jgi:UDP-N-acetylglucosamine transferase subunit ALG13
MILITVGTEQFPFNRLMGWIDNLIQQQILNPELEEIVIQYGCCTIIPTGKVKTYSVLRETDFHSFVRKARIIIAHCGEGSIDLLASIVKPFILVPRSFQFGEHVDDHQIELAKELSRLGIPVANCQEDLADFLVNPISAEIPMTPSNYYFQASLMLETEFENASILEELSADLIEMEHLEFACCPINLPIAERV